MSKLTKRVVDAAEVRAREYFIWDEELPGFGLRVLPSGRKRYIIQYRAVECAPGAGQFEVSDLTG